MYKININKIRALIVQLTIKPSNIKEYDTHVDCIYNDDLILTIDNNKVIIINKTNSYDDIEVVKITDLEYMNIVISDYYESRKTTS